MSVESLIHPVNPKLWACRITTKGDLFGAELKEYETGKIGMWPVQFLNAEDMEDFGRDLQLAAEAFDRVKSARK